MADWIVQREDGTVEEGHVQQETTAGSPQELPGPQLKAIEALLGGATFAAAAEKAGVNRSTVHRWLKVPRFAAELNRAKRLRRLEVRGELQGLAAAAVKTLREVLESAKEKPALRVRVAMGILKAIGADSPEEIGAEDANALEKEWIYEERMHASRTGLLKMLD